MKNFFFLVIPFFFSCKKEKGPSASEIYFPRVKKIVEVNCTVSCHAPSKGFLQGMPVELDSDSAIVARGNAIKTAVTGPFSLTNKRMPPGYMLSAGDIDVITQWLAHGGTTNVCGIQ